MARKNCRADGGTVKPKPIAPAPDYTGSGKRGADYLDEVVKSTTKKKRGGALAFEGESMTKPKKASGGGVGSDKSPFSSAGGGSASKSPFSSAHRR